MTISAQILAFNIDRFLPHCIYNALGYSDKIYILYPGHSWAKYGVAKPNPTSLESILKYTRNHKSVQVIVGEWFSEEEMREYARKLAQAEGYRWHVVQDADEFYSQASVDYIKAFLANSVLDVDYLKGTWINYWKHPSLALRSEWGSIKSLNACFAINLNSPKAFFFDKRNISVDASFSVIDAVAHHYGYCMSDDEMRLKIKTWGHSKDFDTIKWFELKWLNCKYGDMYLHPVNPSLLSRAVFLEQAPLPLAALIFPDLKLAPSYFPPAVSSFASISLRSFLYDFSINIRLFYRALRKLGKLFCVFTFRLIREILMIGRS